MDVDSSPAPNVTQGRGKAQKPVLPDCPDSVINTPEPNGKQQGEEYGVPVEDDLKHMKHQKSVEFSTLCLSELVAALLKFVSGQNRCLPCFGIRDPAVLECVPLKFTGQSHQLR